MQATNLRRFPSGMDHLDSIRDQYYERRHQLASEFETRELNWRDRCIDVSDFLIHVDRWTARNLILSNIHRQRMLLIAFT
jgi:hypothetical protein